MDTIRFKLKEGINRLCTEAQELSHTLVIEADDVYETDIPAVINHLDAHPACERVVDEVAKKEAK